MKPLDGKERLGKKPDIYDDLTSFSGEELFERLDAQEWIDKFRVEAKDGSLDMLGTAAKLGIPLAPFDAHYKSDPITTKAYITGVSTDVEEPIGISISPLHIDEEARNSLGHELGHYFLFQQGYLHDDSYSKLSAEYFCDVFGREMALPSGYLEHIDTVDGAVIDRLKEMFKTSYDVTFTQLMKSGKLPRAVLIDMSIGETPNPLYNNRLTRIAVCYDCEINEPHEADFSEAPIIDMTHGSGVFRKMSSSVCSMLNPIDISLIEMVEREHGIPAR